MLLDCGGELEGVFKKVSFIEPWAEMSTVMMQFSGHVISKFWGVSCGCCAVGEGGLGDVGGWGESYEEKMDSS